MFRGLCLFRHLPPIDRQAREAHLPARCANRGWSSRADASHFALPAFGPSRQPNLKANTTPQKTDRLPQTREHE